MIFKRLFRRIRRAIPQHCKQNFFGYEVYYRIKVVNEQQTGFQ